MNSSIRLWFAAFLFLFIRQSNAQVVTTSPSFPTMDDNITLTFDATQGDGGLNNFTGTVYGHFGLITSGPTGTAWNIVVGNWGTADPNTQMTRVGTNLYQITFKPRTYFPGATSVTGYRLGMVFRNSTGSLSGRAAGGSDIFVKLYQAGEKAVLFFNPNLDGQILTLGSSLPFTAKSSVSANLSVTDNGAVIGSATGTVVSGTIASVTAGQHRLRVFADYGGGVVLKDSISYFVGTATKTQALPAGALDGPNYISPTQVVLVLAAPGKGSVYVKGDFNTWQMDTAYAMRRTPDGSRFWLQINNLTAGREYVYQFVVDGTIVVADPRCDKTSASDDAQISAAVYPNLIAYPSQAVGTASVLRPGRAAYTWKHSRPAPISKDRTVIYELLLRDFLGDQANKTLYTISLG
jgi:hypothetical protein